MMCTVKSTLIRISIALLIKLFKQDAKIDKKHKRPQIVKPIPRRKDRDKGFKISNLYIRATLMEVLVAKDVGNRIENGKTIPHSSNL